MKLQGYNVIANEKLNVFEFISEGPKGNIIKLVQYDATDFENLYNLCFGDKDYITGEIDDKTTTNNGDSRKILATVAGTIYKFLERYPDVYIYAEGSNKARTRLYRIGITNNLSEILKDFEVYGLSNGHWNQFQKKYGLRCVSSATKKNIKFII